MKKFFDECVKEANKAYNNNDVPVGAIVVFNNKIIGRGHNNRNITNDVTAHAEVIAIKKASLKLGDWRLHDCDLYVTLEPCSMCKEIIKESRIKNVYYLVKKDEYKHSYNKTNMEFIKSKDLEEIVSTYKQKISDFFIVNCNR